MLEHERVVASKEAGDAMSVETGSSAESGVGWGGELSGSRGRLGRRRALSAGISEVRGPAASMRRDSVFRRLLVVADVLAIVTAFVLTVELSRRSLALTWAGIAAVPILVVCAKLTGLYE